MEEKLNYYEILGIKNYDTIVLTDELVNYAYTQSKQVIEEEFKKIIEEESKISGNMKVAQENIEEKQKLTMRKSQLIYFSYAIEEAFKAIATKEARREYNAKLQERKHDEKRKEKRNDIEGKFTETQKGIANEVNNANSNNVNWPTLKLETIANTNRNANINENYIPTEDGPEIMEWYKEYLNNRNQNSTNNKGTNSNTNSKGPNNKHIIDSDNHTTKEPETR